MSLFFFLPFSLSRELLAPFTGREHKRKRCSGSRRRHSAGMTSPIKERQCFSAAGFAQDTHHLPLSRAHLQTKRLGERGANSDPFRQSAGLDTPLRKRRRACFGSSAIGRSEKAMARAAKGIRNQVVRAELGRDPQSDPPFFPVSKN